MIFDVAWPLALICVTIVFLGAVVQGAIGIGIGLIAAPVLALVDRDFVPAAILIAVVPLTVGVSLREREAIDRRGAGLALLGRLPGVLVGAFALAWTGPTFLAVLVGTSVLLAVVASFANIRFHPTARAIFVAGVASGFTGTTTGVGGPPIALTYQHSDPAVMRATISAYFTVGSFMSIGALALAGALEGRHWQLGGLLIPGVVAGLYVSRRHARLLRTDRARVLILVVCALSAIGLLVEELLLSPP